MFFKSKDKLILDKNSASCSIAFIGTRGGAGVTQIATSIAKEFADSGKHVLYIDFNLDRPNAFRYLGVPSDKLKSRNMAALKHADIVIEDLILETSIKRLKLFSVDEASNIGDSLGIRVPTCEALINIAISKFDVVIVDCDPNLYSEATTAALRTISLVLTVTEPDNSLLPTIIKMQNYTTTFTNRNKINYIIQNRAISRVFTEGQLKAIGVRCIGVQYYSDELAENGYSHIIIDRRTSTSTEIGKEYKELLGAILERVSLELSVI